MNRQERHALTLGLTTLLAVLGAPMASAQVSNEVWPEVQYHHWFNGRTQAVASMASSFNSSTQMKFQTEQSLSLEYRFTDIFFGRIGIWRGGATEGDNYNEKQLQLDQTFRVQMPSKIITEYRTREDFRSTDTGFSMRFRERIQIQRGFTVGSYAFTPYTSAEVYWDTRYGRLSRYRLTVGVRLPVFNRHYSFDPYLVHQVDTAGDSEVTNGLGLRFNITF